MKNKPCLFLLTILASLATSATTLQKFTFEQLVDLSELIIEGEVTSVYPVDAGKLLHTRVLIKVQDVLKGDYPGEFIELEFLGGEEEGKALVVSGQVIPEEGEKAFYFIEDVASQAVNPLTGWSQGHFRILSDLKGNQFLETDVQHELVELSETKNAALAAKLRAMKFSHALVEQAYYQPVSPDELRDAVARFLTAD